MPLTVHARQIRNTPILDLVGSLTIGPSLSLLYKQANQTLEETKPARLLLNIEGLAQIDSAGIGEIVKLFSAAARLNCRLALVGANKKILQVLRITRVDGVVPTFEDEAAALADE